mmetsp:Transcript_38917/g.86571  ORF Transcript_38917/g.86571 Transcript_38917/m.86571 type:complete len:221 (+) Transcript_38917:121-783(+)
MFCCIVGSACHRLLSSPDCSYATLSEAMKFRSRDLPVPSSELVMKLGGRYSKSCSSALLNAVMFSSLLLEPFFLRSILVNTMLKGTPLSVSQVAYSRSIFCGLMVESTSRSTMARLEREVKYSLVKESNASRLARPVRAYPYPGRSTRYQLSFMRKWLMQRVLPGSLDTWASFLLLVSMLMREDLPTLERPMMANSGYLGAGQSSWRTALLMYEADLTLL